MATGGGNGLLESWVANIVGCGNLRFYEIGRAVEVAKNFFILVMGFFVGVGHVFACGGVDSSDLSIMHDEGFVGV